MSTGIEWTDATWNPVAGCEYISDGCLHCYAARDAAGRLRGVPVYVGLAVKEPGEPAKFTGEIRAVPDRIEDPIRWQRPRRIFVNSMSDLFHPGVLGLMHTDRFDVEHPYLAEVFATMVRASHHQFQVLTKRPQIMAAVMREPRFRLDVNALLLRDAHPVMPGGMTDRNFTWPKHLWMGTSIELDKFMFRARHAAAAGAAVTFLSLEPLLGPLPSLDLTGIGWVIVGGESGPDARPMHPDWVREIRDRCVSAGVPFLFKQWGEWCTPDQMPPECEGSGGFDAQFHRVGKKNAGRLLDGRTWDEYPA